jgi:DNA gyrase subunit A
VQVLVTITDRGYIKRVNTDQYRTQGRGGKGIKGMTTREQDVVQHMATCRTLDSLLFFTDRGKVYQLKTHEVPDAGRAAKGLPLVNLISLEPNEQITSVMPVSSFDGEYLVMATVKGKIKRTLLSEYAAVRSNGLIAIGLEDGDSLRWVRMSQGDEDLLLTSRSGQTIRFKQAQVRSMGRPAAGVTGIALGKDDEVVGMDLVQPGAELLVVTCKGQGKRTMLDDYPVKGRATSGVITMKLRGDDRIVVARVVNNSDTLTFITRNGIVIRLAASSISSLGRSTQGVRVINLNPGDEVAASSVEAPGEEESNPAVMSAAELVPAATNGQVVKSA